MNTYENQQLNSSQLPTLKAIDFEPLAPGYPALSSLETAVSWLFILVPLNLANWLVEAINLPYTLILGLIGFAIFTIGFSYFAAKAKGFALRERDFLYRQGLIWKKQTGISFKRIQHIETTHGPIERHFSLMTLKFYTAGGAQADLKVSGLTAEQAKSIQALVMSKTEQEDDTVDG